VIDPAVLAAANAAAWGTPNPASIVFAVDDVAGALHALDLHGTVVLGAAATGLAADGTLFIADADLEQLVGGDGRIVIGDATAAYHIYIGDGTRADELVVHHDLVLRNPAAGGEKLGVGMRIAVELVAGVVAGAFIGLMADQWLGTKPWLLIVGFVLGCCAAFLNVYRVAQAEERRSRAASREDKS